MRVISSRTRWLVPGVVAGAVALAAVGVTLSASATPSLPPKSPAQLLVALQSANVSGLSGTVVQTSALGLPSLPVPSGGQGSSDLTSLVSGSHTIRIWYAGPQRVRMALLGTLGESDVIRNGRDVWLWNSDRNTATHVALPAQQAKPSPGDLPGNLPKTPQEAADAVLKLLGPTTDVATNGTETVAGRSAYGLVLSPKDSRSLIGSVRVAVDAERSVPLRVQVLPKNSSTPAFAVGFTQVSFATPDQREFQFSPPPGAKVTEQSTNGRQPNGEPRPGSNPGPAGTSPRTVGTGWTTVAVARVPADLLGAASGRGGSASNDNGGVNLGAILASLPRVSGAWGSGRLLTGNGFSMVITDDGRLAVGAVGPDLLYAALGHR
jgi:outer membrane lipoprotein-sorting protein